MDLGLAGLTKAHTVVPRVGTAFGNGQIDADITLIAEIKKPRCGAGNLKRTGAERKSIDSIPVTDFLTISGDNFVFILFG